MSQKEGWGIKEGGSWKSWKKRLFCLTSTEIVYFKDRAKTKKMGVIEINKITDIFPVDIYKKRRNLLRIITPSRTYHISFETEKQRDDWNSSLLPYIKKVKPSETKNNLYTMDDFEVISLLGRGAFGKVMLVRFKKDKVIYAMKTVEKAQVIDSNEVEHILSEKNVLAKINNPFLVNMHFSFQTPTHLVFILDFCPGGELFAYLQKHKNGLSEADVKFYCAQIILALEHLHSVGVVYRDIKPENILFEKDGYLKMTDFGLAKTVKDGTTSTFCGTPEYLAPEVVQGMDYDENVDWWGLGILIYEMLFTRSPFLAETLEDLYENILQADPQYPSKKDVSLDCQDFINKLLAKSPTTRLSDVDEMKTHAWFSDLDFDELYKKKLPTPYVPQLKSQTDVSNFDNEIISEHVDLKSNAQPVTDASFFTDFTYVHK